MADLFANGRIIDIVLLVVALEAACLALYRVYASKGLTLVQIFSALAPGVALMLALRAALLDSAWITIAFWLIASFVAHLYDMWQRTKS